MRFCNPEVNDIIKNGPADKVYISPKHGDAHGRLVQVYLGSNTFEFSAIRR